ncbi:MAG: hypothetical protein OEX07_04640 [Gammaproteobacteria bacterium]|nr:hypothetical protein [Gammaproteobacteria bacterium]
MFSNQIGQVLPGALLTISLASGLGVTATPAMTEFVVTAELTSLTYAQSALATSLEINLLLSGSSGSKDLIIEGQKVILKYGYPIAKIQELEKIASFGTQTLIQNTASSVTVWSLYQSWCFTYTEAKKNGLTINPANISDIKPATDESCQS